MKSNTIRNDYAAARISAISAIIAAEAIGVTLLLILIQSLLKAVTPLTSESILMLVLGSFVRTGTTAFCIFGVAAGCLVCIGVCDKGTVFLHRERQAQVHSQSQRNVRLAEEF